MKKQNISTSIKINQFHKHGPEAKSSYAKSKCVKTNLHWCPDDSLNFVTLKQSSQVSVSHLGHGKVVSFLNFTVFPPGSVNLVQFLKSRFGPDDKATNVTTRSELEKIKLVYVDGLYARDVAEGAGKTLWDLRTTSDQVLHKMLSWLQVLNLHQDFVVIKLIINTDRSFKSSFSEYA